jgi:uncharacterized protein YcbX
MPMWIVEIWRYPVKSLRGERLDRATLGPGGIEGDRQVLVRLPNGAVATARRYPRLLALSGTTGPGGEALVDGRMWNSPEIGERIEAVTAPGAVLELADESRFDILPLLVATDSAIAAFGYDGRRLRPNLVIGGVEGLSERDWEGRVLAIGPVRIQLADLRGRCVMTTVDPDTNAQDPEVLRSIVRRFDGRLALNAEVASGGVIAVGDRVALL